MVGKARFLARRVEGIDADRREAFGADEVGQLVPFLLLEFVDGGLAFGRDDEDRGKFLRLSLPDFAELGKTETMLAVAVGQVLGVDAVVNHLDNTFVCQAALKPLALVIPVPCLAGILLVAIGTRVVVEAEVVGRVAVAERVGPFQVVSELLCTILLRAFVIGLVVVPGVLKRTSQETVGVVVVAREFKQDGEALTVEVAVRTFDTVLETVCASLIKAVVLSLLVAMVGLVLVADAPVGVAEQVVEVGMLCAVFFVFFEERLYHPDGRLGVGLVTV